MIINRPIVYRFIVTFVLLFSAPVQGQVYSLVGQLDVITDNTGQSEFSAAVLGSTLEITIDVTTAAGVVSVDFGPQYSVACCIAAGGAETVNDVALDAETASTLNSLLGANQFSVGDVVDILQVEGDQLTPSGSRIEAGVTFVLTSSAILDDEPYVLTDEDVQLSIGFVLEEFMDVDTFSGFGLVFRDSDGDSVPDTQDNCTVVSNPTQLDTDGDGFGNACDPDVDNNCAVNFLDFLLFPPAFGSQEGDVNYDINMDFNEDGNVGFLDLVVIANYFGLPPGPGSQDCLVSP